MLRLINFMDFLKLFNLLIRVNVNKLDDGKRR
jgi:hypothetical protein